MKMRKDRKRHRINGFGKSGSEFTYWEKTICAIKMLQCILLHALHALHGEPNCGGQEDELTGFAGFVQAVRSASVTDSREPGP